MCLSGTPPVLNGKTNDLGSLDGPTGGFTRRRHDKIGEGAPFDFGGMLQQCVNIVRQSLRPAEASVFAIHDKMVVRSTPATHDSDPKT